MDAEQLEEMRSKVDETHSALLIRMLGVNELPEIVLERYFVIKGIMDKVDGFIGPEGLLRIAMDVGLNLETMRFGEGPVLATKLSDLEETEENPFHKVREKYETQQKESDEAKIPIPDVSDDPTALALGTKVRFLDKNGIQEGTVKESRVDVVSGLEYDIDTGESVAGDIPEKDVEVI